ncbi:MAG: CRISPR system precrRNA processing endoribonuclease RAMP protein Cas6 [Syntrophales bacterium]|nr:CRISPR system precrRNA processing endoribonuclease RAMP protein Cas6 [Syntrophales bacterium]
MRVGKYTFDCIFREEAILPEYKGSTFRGVLGHALKKIVCALKNEKCDSCILNRSCLYINLFDPSAGHRGVPPPPPYVIEPEDGGKTNYRGGDKFTFQLLLFGKANDYLPHFVYAFNEIGEQGIGKKIKDARGRFSLRKVKNDEAVIYDGQEGKIFTWPEPKDYLPDFYDEVCCANHLTVRLLTPLRVKYENHLVAQLPFHILVRAALRRISVLFEMYGEGEPRIDYRGLIERSLRVQEIQKDLRWFDWSRYSRRQEQKMMMGGLVGTVSYEGEIGEFIPFLRFCELVHLGKQTAFGLGKISLEIEQGQ